MPQQVISWFPAHVIGLFLLKIYNRLDDSLLKDWTPLPDVTIIQEPRDFAYDGVRLQSANGGDCSLVDVKYEPFHLSSPFFPWPCKLNATSPVEDNAGCLMLYHIVMTIAEPNLSEAVETLFISLLKTEGVEKLKYLLPDTGA